MSNAAIRCMLLTALFYSLFNRGNCQETKRCGGYPSYGNVHKRKHNHPPEPFPLNCKKQIPTPNFPPNCYSPEGADGKERRGSARGMAQYITINQGEQKKPSPPRYPMGPPAHYGNRPYGGYPLGPPPGRYSPYLPHRMYQRGDSRYPRAAPATVDTGETSSSHNPANSRPGRKSAGVTSDHRPAPTLLKRISRSSPPQRFLEGVTSSISKSTLW